MSHEKRMNVERDRLSGLPDHLIHKILSSFKLRDVIKQSVLSSRWRFIWTSMPHLNISYNQNYDLSKCSKFVTQVLSRRNNLIDVHSIKLGFRGKVIPAFAKKIMNYAFSHNIEQLDVEYIFDKDVEFPLCLFGSEPLKHLSLTTKDLYKEYNSSTRQMVSRFACSLTSTTDLPTLTTLDLHNVTLCHDEAENCVGIFSKCANLKNLTLNECKVKGSNKITIRHPQLSNLTLESSSSNTLRVVNVTAPQLENFTTNLVYCNTYVVSAHRLASLVYKSNYPLVLSTDGFHSLEKADICVYTPDYTQAHVVNSATHQKVVDAKARDQIVRLLQQLYSVHFLKLNLELVEFLSSSVELRLHQPSPFVNLKSLKIYPSNTSWSEEAPYKVAMSAELKSYLLDGSPKSTLTMVLREDIEAKKIMAELRVLLELEKDTTKINRAHVEPGKARGQHMAPNESLNVQNMGKKQKARQIISKLLSMEVLVPRLPASSRAKIQPCLNNMCAVADTAISKLTDCIKIQNSFENAIPDQFKMDFDFGNPNPGVPNENSFENMELDIVKPNLNPAGYTNPLGAAVLNEISERVKVIETSGAALAGKNRDDLVKRLMELFQKKTT